MRSIRRRALAGLAIVSATALIAGCGGEADGGDSADPAPTPTEMAETTEETETSALSEPELFDEVAAICGDLEDDLDDLDDPTSDDPDVVVAFLDEAIDLQDEAIEELQALEPPADLADAHDEAIELKEEQVELLTEARDRIEDGDAPAEVFEVLGDEADELEDEIAEAFEDLGADGCEIEGGSTSEPEPEPAPEPEPEPEPGPEPVVSEQSLPGLSIPDDDPTGVSDTILIDAPGSVQAIEVDVRIRHPFVGDLTVMLIAPDGSEATLVSNEGGTQDDLTLRINESDAALEPVLGAPAGGDWQLVVVDSVGSDVGTLDAWALTIGTG